MPDTVKALALVDAGKVRLIDREIPKAGPNEAVVRSTASLICTSDVHTPGRRAAVDPTPMTTHRVGIDDAEAAFDMMRHKRDDVVKPLITYG